jgi:hypothetical protein
MVWPCVPVDGFTIHPMPTARCTEWIPLSFTLKGKDGSGYLEPQTQIIYSSSAPIDCNLVHEMHIQDETGNIVLFHAASGTITPFNGTLLSHPLYSGNIFTYNDFHAIIHHPIEDWSLEDVRGHPSLNDIFETIEQQAEVLANLQNHEAPSGAAKSILDRIHAYTPFGWIGQLLSKIQWIWIYVCCIIVTIKTFIPGTALKWPIAAAQGWRQRRKANEIELPELHGPVERLLES